MTLNMRIGAANPTETVATARSEHVDVLTLVEMTAKEFLRLQVSGIGDLFPYVYEQGSSGPEGAAIFSRWPINNEKAYHGFTFALLSVQVNAPTSAGGDGHPITVFASHIRSPWPRTATAWGRELPKLAEVLAAVPGTVIDAGDFNATVDNVAFRHLLNKAAIRDATTEAHSHLVATYPSNVAWRPPLIAIDHVVYRNLVAVSTESVKIGGSDHRALIADFGFPPPQSANRKPDKTG